MSTTLFLILALVVIVGGLLARARVRRSAKGSLTILGDDLLRSILEEEEELRAFDEDEPLDEDVIREAEDEFWAEGQWTDADDWRD